MMRYITVRAVMALILGFAQSNLLSAAEADYSMQMPGAARSLLLDIAAAGERLVAVGERGHILTSEDDGATWMQVEVPVSVMLTRVFFADDSLGWAVGHDGNILHSQDGGVTWVLQRDGLADQIQINEDRAGRSLSRVAELKAEIAVASDDLAEELDEALGDAEWALDNARETLDGAVYAPPLMDVWFASPEQGWAVGAYGTLLRTDNGGRDWRDWSHYLDNPEELHLNGVAGDDRGTLYLVSEWGMVFVSNSSGEAWAISETGYDGSFFGVVVNPASGSVFVYGLLGNIYRSSDSGESWESVEGLVPASLFGAEAIDGALIFVGQGGTATLTDDDGNSFTPMIQPQRDGLFGVTALGDGRFIASGESGSKILVKSAGGVQNNE